MVLPVYNVLSHSHFFKVGEIMSLKYGNSMLLAGHILDLFDYRMLSPFAKIIQSFISTKNT